MSIRIQAVPASNEEIILGYRWLVHHVALLRMSRKCLHFGMSPHTTAYWAIAEKKDGVVRLDPETFEIPQQGRGGVEDVLQRFASVFIETPMQPTTKAAEHGMFKNYETVSVKTLQILLSEQAHNRRGGYDMFERDVIRSSNSPYCSPIVIVIKKMVPRGFTFTISNSIKLLTRNLPNFPRSRKQ